MQIYQKIKCSSPIAKNQFLSSQCKTAPFLVLNGIGSLFSILKFDRRDTHHPRLSNHSKLSKSMNLLFPLRFGNSLVGCVRFDKLFLASFLVTLTTLPLPFHLNTSRTASSLKVFINFKCVTVLLPCIASDTPITWLAALNPILMQSSPSTEPELLFSMSFSIQRSEWVMPKPN